MVKQFLIIHGWGGSDHPHWQAWLNDELLSRGEKVSFPSLPNAMTPTVEGWVSTLKDEIDSFNPEDELIVIGHSLGPAAWIHFSQRFPEIIPSKIYFVAPVTVSPNIEEVSDFFPIPKFNLHKDTECIMVGSDNDQYISFENLKQLSDQYKIPFLYLPGKGHINTDAGYGPWPWMLEECLK